MCIYTYINNTHSHQSICPSNYPSVFCPRRRLPHSIRASSHFWLFRGDSVHSRGLSTTLGRKQTSSTIFGGVRSGDVSHRHLQKQTSHRRLSIGPRQRRTEQGMETDRPPSSRCGCESCISRD